MSPSKRAKPKRRRRRPGAGRRPSPGDTPEVETTGLLVERLSHPETSPALSGGDLDADWIRAQSSGEEAVGGSVTTREARDRDYWHLERRAADQDAGA